MSILFIISGSIFLLSGQSYEKYLFFFFFFFLVPCVLPLLFLCFQAVIHSRLEPRAALMPLRSPHRLSDCHSNQSHCFVIYKSPSILPGLVSSMAVTNMDCLLSERGFSHGKTHVHPVGTHAFLTRGRGGEIQQTGIYCLFLHACFVRWVSQLDNRK